MDNDDVIAYLTEKGFAYCGDHKSLGMLFLKDGTSAGVNVDLRQENFLKMGTYIAVLGERPTSLQHVNVVDTAYMVTELAETSSLDDKLNAIGTASRIFAEFVEEFTKRKD